MRESRLIHYRAEDFKNQVTEHRLLGYRAEDFAANAAAAARLKRQQRLAQAAPPAPQPPVDTSQLRVNPRRADQIAANQSAVHQQALANNKTGGVVQTQTVNGVTRDVQTGMVKTYIDPATGRDSREFDTQGNPVPGTGTLRTIQTTGPVGPQSYTFNPAQTSTVLGTPIGGAMGQQGAVGFNPSIQAGQVGMTANGPVSLEDRIRAIDEKAASDIEFVRAKGGAGGVTEDQIRQSAEEEKANLKEQAEEENVSMQNQARERTEKNTAATSKTKETLTPEAGAMQSYLSNLPPEYQFLGGLMQTVIDEQKAGQEAQQTLSDTLLGRIGTTMDAADAKLKTMEDNVKSFEEKSQGLLDTMKELQDKSIQEAQAAEENRLYLEASKAKRDLAVAKQKAVDSKIVKMAVKNRLGGSDSAMAEIEEAGQYFDTKLFDLQNEVSGQKMELTAKYTGLFSETMNIYYTNSLNNLRDARAEIQKIGMQGIENSQVRLGLENEVLTNLVEKTVAGRKETAGALMTFGEEMVSIVNQEKDVKRAQEQLGWQRLQWVAETYGTSAPQGLIDSISAQLPGVDVASLVASPTLAESREKRLGGGGGGGSSLGFVMSDLDSMGNTPTFEEFIAQRESEMNMSMTPEERSALRAEYDALKGNTRQLSASEILSQAQDKAIALGPMAYKQAMGVVQQRISEGNLSGARDFVDGLGSSPGQTERKDFTQALIVRDSVKELGLLIEDLGMQGPIIGRIRELNPYDSRVVRFDQLTTQAIPALARGIFKEVGVLTDTDIATYRSTMANPVLTKDQAIQATSDLLRKIQLSIDRQVDVWSASKMNVREFRTLGAVPQAQSPEATQPTADISQFLSTYGL